MVDFSTIANVTTALTVIVALAFGVLQLRHFRREREEAAAFEALRAFQTDAFMRAIRKVWLLPPGTRARDVAADPELEEAGVVVSAVFHAMGHLVARGFVPIAIQWFEWFALEAGKRRDPATLAAMTRAPEPDLRDTRA